MTLPTTAPRRNAKHSYISSGDQRGFTKVSAPVIRCRELTLETKDRQRDLACDWPVRINVLDETYIAGLRDGKAD
jgi:hypothetical protein